MHKTAVASAAFVLSAVVLAACGGNPPPEPEPAPTDTSAAESAPDADSLAAAREAEAADLCSRAEAAMRAGRYDEARRLFQRALDEYSETGCGRTADRALTAVNAVEVVKERVHFEYDRSRITDEAAEILRRKAEVLRQYPDWELTIEGHCDERGSLEYNQALGMRRASATQRYLVSLGLDADRFSTVSYGEERPIAQGSNETAWSRNRRAEFVIENPGAAFGG